MSDKNKKRKKDKKISEAVIKIRVYMRFGAEIRQKRAEYSATEKRDEYNNLVVINEEYDHNEDVDFSQEEVYAGMNVTLGLDGLSKEACTQKLKKQIELYKKRQNAIEKHVELNALANIHDVRRRIKEMEIYLKYISFRSEQGAYFTMEDGVRVYCFESLDGFLIPIWHGADNLTDYPDFTRKKKIVMQETASLINYFDTKGGKQLMFNALIMVMVITALIFGANLWGGFKLWNEHKSLVDKWQEPANYCADQMVQTYSIVNKVLQNAVVKEYVENADNETQQQIDEKIRELTG